VQVGLYLLARPLGKPFAGDQAQKWAITSANGIVFGSGCHTTHVFEEMGRPFITPVQWQTKTVPTAPPKPPVIQQ